MLVLRSDNENEKKRIRSEVENLMKECILNPGTLHIGNGFMLLHKNASSLKLIGFDRIAGVDGSDTLRRLWKKEKVVDLNELNKLPVWTRKSIQKGKRYAIWGMGVAGSFLADAVNCSGGKLALVVDHDSVKWDTDFYGATAHGPEYLLDHQDEYDYLLIGHYSRFDEIYAEAVGMGVDEAKIIMPYEV